MFNSNIKCIDTGTENCPCHLAELGGCIVCSRLAGKGFCDCNWQGACIYNEYLQNNGSVNGWRYSDVYDIEKMTWYEKDLVVMRIKVPRGLAEKASRPGSFVFVRRPGTEQYFDTPVSVMRSCHEEGWIDFAIKVNGPKTRSITSGDREILLRGIYKNGLLGTDKLMEPGQKKVLCLTKGIGLAPVINYARWADGKDEIDIIADTEKVTRRFAEDVIGDGLFNKVVYSRLPMKLSWAIEEKYDAIVICASDYYQQKIYVPEQKKILSNNHTMCCGEGICGACMRMDNQGNVYRTCKCTGLWE